jgi:hypothetical protein
MMHGEVLKQRVEDERLFGRFDRFRPRMGLRDSGIARRRALLSSDGLGVERRLQRPDASARADACDGDEDQHEGGKINPGDAIHTRLPKRRAIYKKADQEANAARAEPLFVGAFRSDFGRISIAGAGLYVFSAAAIASILDNGKLINRRRAR